MKFFRVIAGQAAKDGWFIDDPLSKDGKEIDAREFTQGRPYLGHTPYRVPLSKNGRSTELTLAAFDMPIISQKVGEILERICPAEIERFPVIIETANSGYEILNITHAANCLDESRSEIMTWKPEDGRPEKVGKYRMVTNLTIDPTRVCNKHMFRVNGWEIALIVSEQVKKTIEQTCIIGVNFDPVC